MSNDTTQNLPTWDVIVIGGSVAGLSGALTLLRARRRVLILDTSLPRNRFTSHMHGLIGRDHTDPADLVADACAEVEGYGADIRTEAVESVVTSGSGFTVSTDQGTHSARQVLVATGGNDVLPEIDGLAEFWGQGIASCPYCDGYEVRDQRIGVLATGPHSIFHAQMLRQWSDKTILFTDGKWAPEGEELRAFEARNISLIDVPVSRILSHNSALSGVELEDGTEVEVDAIFTIPEFRPRDGVLDGLGLERTETPMGEFIATDPTGATAVPGLWLAGNVAKHNANVPVSIGDGAMAAAMMNHQLVLEDIAGAVASDAADGN